MAASMIDIAGDAIESACRLEKCQPSVPAVIWAFAFATGLVLFREGFAKRVSSDEWAMHSHAAKQLLPEVSAGLTQYLRICPDGGNIRVPDMDDFLQLTVPSALAVATDVRLQREQEPTDLLAVMNDKLKLIPNSTAPSEVRLMLFITKRLFNTVGLVDPGS